MLVAVHPYFATSLRSSPAATSNSSDTPDELSGLISFRDHTPRAHHLFGLSVPRRGTMQFRLLHHPDRLRLPSEPLRAPVPVVLLSSGPSRQTHGSSPTPAAHQSCLEKLKSRRQSLRPASSAETAHTDSARPAPILRLRAHP